MPPRKHGVLDKEMSQFQVDLLNLAFDTATSIPVEPHIKDRSKAQEAVVATCLELGQPMRAEAFIEKMNNWRCGLCYARLALYCEEQGYSHDAQEYLKLAEHSSEGVDGWRKDQITAVINQVRDLPKQVHEQLEKEDLFDEQVASLDAMIAAGGFDSSKNALTSYAQLFDCFYENTERRLLIEEKIKTSWDKLPMTVRFELLTKLADIALQHSDPQKALELVNDTQSLLDDYQWPPDVRIPMMATLIELRFRSGDVEKARLDADAAQSLFNSQKEKILNIDRAQTLRSLAEAYHTIGDAQGTLLIYKLAVEAGTENPNSRPRAEDLSATCCSMALNSVEPDAALWTRIYQIKDGLGQPW